MPIRLGIVGTGLIWMRTHKPILATMPAAFTPIAFCDADAARRAATALEFPGAAVLSDYHALLELPAVEAVLVLTPIALNAPVAQAALRAGKHVIMEKPIARSVAEGRELIATARQAGRRLFVTEQLAYRGTEDQLAAILAAGEIGELVVWEYVQHIEPDTAPEPLRYASTEWRKRPDFPLGTMFDGGIHLIASLSKVFGAPETVAATGKQLQPEYGAYDHVAAMFQYANGSTGMLSYSSYLQPAQNRFHVYGSAGMIGVESDRIVIEKPDRPARAIELPAEQAYLSMWHALAKALQTQSDPFYTPERALHDVATLEAIDQAIRSGERVRVAAPSAPSV